MTEMLVIRPSQVGGLADRVAPADRQFRRRLAEEGHVTEVPQLVWGWPEDRPAMDWVGTADMTRLVSPRVRTILDDHLGQRDEIQWLPATLTMPTGELLPYWVMHFPVFYDVLHISTNWDPAACPSGGS